MNSFSLIITSALPSVQQQALEYFSNYPYDNFELIFTQGLDDSLLNKYKKNINIVVFEKNRNSDFLNIGIAINHAKGKYLKITEDTLGWPSNYISDQLTLLEQNYDCSLLTSKVAPSPHQIPSNLGCSPLLPIHSQSLKINGRDVQSIIKTFPVNWIGLLSQCLFRKEHIIDYCPSIFSIAGNNHLFLDELSFFTNLLNHGNLLIHNHLPTECINLWNIGYHAGIEAQIRTRPEFQEEQKKFTQSLEKLGIPDHPVITCHAKTLHTHKHVNIDIYQAYQNNIWHEKTNHNLLASLPSDICINQIYSNITPQKKIGIYAKSNSIDTKFLESNYCDKFFSIYQENDITSIKNECDWVIFVETDTTLTTAGLLQFVVEISKNPAVNAIYSDYICIDELGKISPIYLPTCNLDFMLSNPFLFNTCVALRTEIIKNTADIKTPHATFKLLLETIIDYGVASVGHIPKAFNISKFTTAEKHEMKEIIANHLADRGYPHSSSILVDDSKFILRHIYAHHDEPLVSIIIKHISDQNQLYKTVCNILKITKYLNYGIIISNNSPIDKSKFRYLEDYNQLGSSRILFLEKFKEIASKSHGDYLIFLNDNIIISDPDWIKKLLNDGMRPEVGLVAPKIETAKSSFSFGPEILGHSGLISKSLIHSNLSSNSSYLNKILCTQNVNCTSDACYLINKLTLTQIYKLQEKPEIISHTELCLQLISHGLLIVWTPLLCVQEIKSNRLEKSLLDDIDANNLLQKYQPLICHDTSHNPNLSTTSQKLEPSFKIDIDWHLEENKKSIIAIPADNGGCGHYRIIQPALSIGSHGIAHVQITQQLPNITDILRTQANHIILQRPFTEELLNSIKKLKFSHDFYTILDIDDNYIDIPIYNPNYKKRPKDIEQRIKDACSLVDKLIVSTDNLANRFSDFHSNIEVRENLLPIEWWRDLPKSNPLKTKPRIGWGGGSSHHGDLTLLFQIIKDLSNEVDWIFLGMCPENIKPYIKEFHFGVNIERYPEKLSELNLDLALAPLEDNEFNLCKSQLRLLEYGACGYPVICSDIGPYQKSNLPVIKVKNDYHSWMNAIKSYLKNPDIMHKDGQLLMNEVKKNYFLSKEKTLDWFKSWTEK